MASLENQKIKDTYEGLIKTIDNDELSSTPKELTDGNGNTSGVYLDNAGNLRVNNEVSFGSLKDAGENITITKFVDEADGIANNDNDTTIPTSASVKDYVDTKITAEDLDFSTNSGSGSVDLDSQDLEVVGSNGITTSGANQTITIDGSTLQNSITTNANNISSNDTDISALQSRATAIETKTDFISVSQNVNLDSMESDISTNATNISNNASAISTNQSNISSNDTDISALQNRATNIEAKTDFISVTQAVDLDTMESNIATNNAKNSYPSADATKVGFISVTQAVDLDTMESGISTNSGNISTNAGNISTNTSNISTNAGDISTNAGNIATNTSNISTNTSNISSKLAISNPSATGDRITISATGTSTGLKLVQGSFGQNTFEITNSGAYKYINNSSYSTTTPQFTISSDRITYGTGNAYGFGGSGFYIGGSTSANLLDEYETGTYNPNLLILAMGGVSVTLNASHSNVTSWTNNSTYVKIGDVVHVNVDLTFKTSSWYTSTLYTMALSNLPFTPVQIYSATGGYYTNGVNTSSGASSYATYRFQGFSYSASATHIIGFFKAVASGQFSSSNHFANHFNATGSSSGQQIKGQFIYTTS